MAWEGDVSAQADPGWYRQRDEFAWGGEGNQRNVHGQELLGTSGADQDVARFRGMGQPQYVSGPVIDQGQANEARGYQTDAIGMLDRTASGAGPTAATLLQRQQTQDAINAQTSLAGGVKGGAAARVAAARAARYNAARAQAVGAQGERAIRAGEAADARSALMSATTQLRDQDVGVATNQARLDLGQRASNDQREANYERLAWETRNAELGARLGRTAAEQAAASANAALDTKDSALMHEQVKDVGTTVVGGGMGALQGYARSQSSGSNPRYGYFDDDNTTSDVRAKLPAADVIVPVYGDESTDRLRIGDSDRAFFEQPAADRDPAAKFHAMQADMESRRAAASKTARTAPASSKPRAGRQPTPEELMAWADATKRQMADEYGARMDAGPAVYVRDTTISDDRAKLKEVYLAGRTHQMNLTNGSAVILPHGTDEERLFTETAKSHPLFYQQAIKRVQPPPTEDREPPTEGREPNAYVPTPKRGLVTASSDMMTTSRPMAQANRSMAASPYIYKPEYTPPGQEPGEPNVGPMAQNMAADPVARTAVVRRPDGMLAIDKEKALKLTMGGLASLQSQVDELKRGKK